MSADIQGLTEREQMSFDIFGFVVLRDFYNDRVAEVSAAFDKVFAESNDHFVMDGSVDAHTATDPATPDMARQVLGDFVGRDPVLADLAADERLHAILEQVLGSGYSFIGSDGNLMSCDLSWHIDSPAHQPQKYVKVFYYLDPLTESTGALRMLPGSSNGDDAYSMELRKALVGPILRGGEPVLDLEDIPYFVAETQPGDVIVSRFETIHSSFGGKPGRRLFTLNYAQPKSA